MELLSRQLPEQLAEFPSGQQSELLTELRSRELSRFLSGQPAEQPSELLAG